MIGEDFRRAGNSPITVESVAGRTVRIDTLLGMVPPALLALALLFRARQYLSNRSLWLDEACLSLNILHRAFSQLWQPLDYHQGAPIGFLLLQKSAVSLLGTSEYALRLVPFLAGILSVFLFYALAKRTAVGAGIPLAVALFALSPSLIYYSSEAKQYASDVAIAILLVYLAVVAADSDWNPNRMIVLGAIGAIAVWLSHPSVFVLSGTWAVILAILIVRKDWRKLMAASATLAMWGGSFAVCYFTLLRKLSHDSFLLAYWQLNFMPFPPRSVGDLKWFEDSFLDFFSSSAALRFSGLAGLTFILGCLSLFRRRRYQLLLFLSPIAPILVAAGMHKYPFGGRLTLFLVPVALLLMAEGAEAVREAVGNRLPLAGVFLFGLLLVDPGLYTLHRFATPLKANGRTGVMPLEEIRPVMAYLKSRLQSGDAVYVYHAAQPAFEYYAEQTDFPLRNVVIGDAAGDNPHAYESDLARFGDKRVWIVTSHMESVAAAEPKYLRFYLSLTDQRIESFVRPGAETELYDSRPIK